MLIPGGGKGEERRGILIVLQPTPWFAFSEVATIREM